jgi:hypothetical protein
MNFPFGRNMQTDDINILMVDDHPENLLALEAILDSLGQNLVRANSGEQALRCLLNQDFAVILLDVQMPGMDGFETAALIRQRERSRHTPIIFLTAFSKSEAFVSKGYETGAVDYLMKPVVPEILKAKVAVFVELFQKTAAVKRQAAQLESINISLKESEQRFRALSTCSPVGIFVIDITGRCSYTNPFCQSIFGSTLDTQKWLQSIHPEDRDRVFTDWSTWTRSNKAYSNEFRLFTKGEIIRWVHVQSSPMFSEQGKFIGHVGTVADITERKQAEAAQAQVLCEQVARQQAEAANQMKDEFLATLSHELRTPLNSMLGWTRLLRTRKFDQTTIDRALETIERNAKLQAQLIEDILDVSRIIRGKLRLHLRPINLVSVIETALDAVRPQSEAKHIELVNLVEPAIGLVSGDPDRLQQIIWNLLTNAIKFTPKKGKVEVRLVSDDSHVHIEVSDTGVGIRKEFLPYIFDRFRQADSTTTRAYGGLGLGLAIARHLVELHNGTVNVDSNGENQGATFTVKLPLLPDDLNESDDQLLPIESNLAQIETRSELENLQILVVDDQPEVCEILTVILQGSGAKVTAVCSAAAAIKAIAQLQPDILISDIGMPDEDGYTLLGKIRNLDIKQGGQIPAIALTAYVRQEDCTNALLAGFQMHLSKPVDSTELIKAVAELTGRIQKIA